MSICNPSALLQPNPATSGTLQGNHASASNPGSQQNGAAGTSQRSTRGASKQRRDQINIEIQRLRDLLPLSESIKDRLYQLQIMSLGCIYMRKHRYLQHVVSSLTGSPMSSTPKGIEVCKALKGFMLMITRSGKLLHVSDNASEYLGHSVEEIMCQGDSIYDLVDPLDHAAVQSELGSGPPAAASFPEERVFLCRLNLTRAAAKRQLQYHKFILLQGRYIHPAEYYQTLASHPDTSCQQIQPMFAAFCQPLINPENAESLSTGNTNIFTSQHYLDMKFKQVDNMFSQNFGYSNDEMEKSSWYQHVHPNHVPELAFKHRLLCDEKEGSVLCLLRMMTREGEWIWLHTVLAIRGNFTHEVYEGRRVRHVIHCYYQILSDMEAATLQANSWIYTKRFTYPAAFPCQDSCPSDQEDEVSPSPPPTAPLMEMKPEIQPFGFPPNMSLHFPIPCDQIKVEIECKPQNLCLFTPESSSPESAVSFQSSVMNSVFLDSHHSLLDELTSTTKGALPELRDEVDEFFREVEQPVHIPAHPSIGAAPIAMPLMVQNHSPQEASELYKYLGPALFSQPIPYPHHQPQTAIFHSRPPFHLPNMPQDCADYSATLDPFFNRKLNWAV